MASAWWGMTTRRWDGDGDLVRLIVRRFLELGSATDLARDSRTVPSVGP